MANNHTWSLPVNTSHSRNISSANNTEGTTLAVYVFTPVRFKAKVALCLMFGVISTMGFLGNCFMLLYLRDQNKKARSGDRIHSNCFMKNLNLYLRNLALSHLLSCAVLPLVCIQVSFDVFQSGWKCKMVRYLSFVFVSVTINILVVISLEKYWSTRRIPRTFSASTVGKMVATAWVLGFLAMLIPGATYDGQRLELNITHFTVVCKYRENFYPFRLTAIFIPVQFVAPFLFITFVNISLVRIVWVRSRRKIACSAVNNPLKAKLIAVRIRGISLLIAITFAFIVTYFLYLSYIVYKQIAKPELNFETDYVLSYAWGAIAYLSCSANVVIFSSRWRTFAHSWRISCAEELIPQTTISQQLGSLRTYNTTIYSWKVFEQFKSKV